MINYGVCNGVHASRYAIIAHESQASICDNSHCSRQGGVSNARMARLNPDTSAVFARLDALGLTQRELAGAIGIDENMFSKVKKGIRQFKGGELVKALRWLEQMESQSDPDHDAAGTAVAYVPVEVLPTYAGMGGGGTGDGDAEMALVPRSLVVDVLRGKPSDFLLINVRGDSMEPDFRHGDQILIDRRDVSPAQPGPFALWDGDWGEYVIKNVERTRSGDVRIFSSNKKYTAESAPSEATRIIGRPVWFGRRI